MGPTRVLLTGCSGGGKSTLLAELARRGHMTVAEPGRRVIAAERAAGGDALPWEDLSAFLRACLAMAEADFDAATPGLSVFDRGVIDAAAGLRRLGDVASAEQALAARRYARVVLVPPWEDLFAADPDPDRRHGFSVAVAEYKDIVETLHALSCAPVLLPKTDVVARADWLETALQAG